MALTLYLEFDGESGQRRPVIARRRSAREGRKVPIAAEPEALAAGLVYVLFRRDHADLVLGASATREVLEKLRVGMGRASDRYDIAAVPVAAREVG